MIGGSSHKCSCITSGNSDFDSCNELSPWKTRVVRRRTRMVHVRGRPGYLEDFAREWKHSNTLKNNFRSSTNKSLHRKPASANYHKFSHLRPEEHIVSYRNTCSSVSSIDNSLQFVENTSNGQPLVQK